MANVISSISRIFAASGLVAASNACLIAGRETGIIARKVAGESWDKVPGAATNEKLVVELSPEFERRLAAHIAAAKAKQGATTPQPASAPAKGVSHSPLVEWHEWHWVPSQAAQEAARAKGQKEAYLPHLYKAANALISLVKYGKGDLGVVFKGRSYAQWICVALAGHAEYLRTRKGVADAHSRLGQYYAQAVKLSKTANLPSWEEVKAAAAPAKQAKPEPAPQPAPAPEPPVEEVPEVREGRAPAFDDLDAEAEVSGAEPEPEPEVVRKYDDLRKAVGVTAVRASNAKGAALKAAAAFKAGKINSAEFDLFIKKAASKFPEGSKEAAEILSVA